MSEMMTVGFESSSPEDWMTKRKLETKTTKSIERKVIRNVVLEDGRIIEEDEPLISRDIYEDTKTHEKDHSLPDSQSTKSSLTPLESSWKSGSVVLTEKRLRNITSNNISENCTKTSSGIHLGDLSSDDVEKVVNGRSVKSLLKHRTPAAQLNSANLVLKSQILHRSSNSKGKVTSENIHEMERQNDRGQISTERIVSKEIIEDSNGEIPEDGDSVEEIDFKDGDTQIYSKQIEDRFIDYYRVPKGKPLSQGTKIGKGIHMSSVDTEKKFQPIIRIKSSSDSRRSRSSSRERPFRVDVVKRNSATPLKRSKSFNAPPSPNLSQKSLLGSMKNMYNSLMRGKKKNRVVEANKAWFEDHPPVRPPRRYGSKTALTDSSTKDSFTYQKSSTLQRRPKMEETTKSKINSSTLGRLPRNYRRSPAPLEPPPPLPSLYHKKSEAPGKIERRKTFTAYDGNRDLPVFEPERHRHRFFGQIDDEDDENQEIETRSRPPPDMRRLLLTGINESRRKSLCRDIESKRTPLIRAI